MQEKGKNMKRICFNKFKKNILLLIIILLVIILYGCNNTKNNSDDSLDKVLQSGQLILGFDTEFPPMGYIDENGKTVGFDIDVAKEAAKRLGVELVLRPIDWDYKENDLNNYHIDCIWNGFSITPERSKTINFTDPYMRNAIIVLLPTTSMVMNINDIAGKIVGVQSGSTAEDILLSLPIYKKIYTLN